MKNLLITGVSRGLGLEISKELLKNGHAVYGVSRTTNGELKSLKEMAGDRFVHFPLDLSDESSAEAVCTFFLKNKIRLDGFINNAAIAYDDLATNSKFNELEKMFMINTIIPILITKGVLRNFLLHRTAGAIVHISSISAHTGYKGLSMYAATKGALEAFSKNISREWGTMGIRSNCVVVGFMNTEMSANLTDDQRNRIYQRTSLKKETSKKSVADVVSFLINNEPEGASVGITGQNIFVDNGTI